MGVPTQISDLSTTASSNSPAGSDAINSGTGPDDYLRAHAALIATLAAYRIDQFAACTSAQLAAKVSDETGTGALVFANTPTLVTPVLGTPTSGTLTNCTGLPVSTGVSGLAANVATFLATPSSANLRSAVTDESGTGALIFANGALGDATATTINKVTLTAPATGSTLTIADGKTLTASNTVTITATDSSTIAAGGGITSGTYTPSLTNVTNITSSTASQCQYLRVGSVVTVSGKVAITATSSGSAVELGMSLPIASDFGNDFECGGSGHASSGNGAVYALGIEADATNNRAAVRTNGASGAVDYAFSFAYLIV